jgi:hypothetical protein
MDNLGYSVLIKKEWEERCGGIYLVVIGSSFKFHKAIGSKIVY